MTVRVFHLGGGCRAVQARERLHLQPLALNGKVAGFPLPSPDSAYSIIQSANLKIIGTDDYSRPEQIDCAIPGLATLIFSAYCSGMRGEFHPPA